MTIILIGYMGSGKSTIGKKLAEILNYDVLDLDDYIQDREKKSIPELFKNKGEIYIRKIESQYLAEIVNVKKNTIISLGGGTPCYGNNMRIILNSGHKSIYLKASIYNLAERLYDDRSSRPLISHLKTKTELTEFIGKHIFERSFFYCQSDLSISVDGLSLSEIIEDIVATLF